MSIQRDINGREIKPGDMLKTFHFRAANRRHGISYLYHVVTVKDGRLWAVPVCHIHDNTGGGSCPVSVMKNAEIVYGWGCKDDECWFRERPMVKEPSK